MLSPSSLPESVLRRNWRTLAPDPGHSLKIELPHEPGFSGASVWKVALADADWCLKALPVDSFAVSRLRGLHRLLRHIRQQGVTQVGIPVPSVNQETFVVDSGRLWQLEPWCHGAPQSEAAPRAARIAAALGCLARWHLSAATFQARDDESRWFGASVAAIPDALRERERLLSEWNSAKFAAIERRILGAPRSESSLLSKRLLGVLRRHAAEIAGELRAAAQTAVPLQPCLRDIWRAHVLFVDDDVTGLIDPHASRNESVAGDLARLLGTLVGNDWAGWTTGLRAYETIRPLKDSERYLIRVYDRTGIVLSAATWLDRLAHSAQSMVASQSALARLRHIAARLRDGLPECPTG